MPILSSINSTNLLSPSLHPDLLQGIQHGPASTYAAFRGTPTIQSKYFPRSSDDHCGPLSPGDMDGAPLQGSPTRSTRLDSGSPSEISFIGAGESSTPVQLVTGQLKSASLSFIQELSDMILRSCITYAASSTFRQHAASASESSSSSSQHYTTQSPPSSSTSIPQKRFSQQDEEHDDDAKQGRDQDPCKPVPPPSDSANAVKLFACPYSKSDPRRYSKQNLRETRYRNCASSYLRDISRLKQHLYRVHALPKHHCVRCYESFKTRGDFGEHARKSPPCQVRSESLYQERMTEDQYDRIHRRVVKGDPCHLWYSIYEILFPKERKPPSPYVSTSDAASVAHFVVLFRAVGPEVMLEVMRDRRERAGGTLEIELPTQMVIDEAFELAAPQFVEGAGRADPQGTSMGRASSCVIPANNNLDAVRRAVLATNEMQHVPGETVLPNMSAAAPDFRAMPEQRGWQAESLETPRQVASQSMLLPAQYTTDSTFTPYWPYGYEFDPSEVTSGFDNYALLGNAQLDATGTALPTILESFPEGGSGYRQHLGYEPLQWPNHV